MSQLLPSNQQPQSLEPRNAASGVQLFAAFLRLGLTAFGGPAMVAYIRELAVTKKQWLSEESFRDGASLCQSIPGATAMQTAAYVGLRAGGPLGALASFVGFGLPAFLLMVGLSVVYQAAHELGPVISAFRGLQVIVIAIIANAALTFGRSSVKNWRDVLLATGAAVFLGLRGSPILAIAAAAALGLILYRGRPEQDPETRPPQRERLWRQMLMPAILALVIASGLGVLLLTDRKLFDLSALMLKIDLFAFGGGFASVPLMLHEVVEVRQWMDSKTFMDAIALGQVTPGPIVITATFVGYQIAGLLGAVAGTISIFAPSFFMVTVTAPYLDRLKDSVLFRGALRGVLASFVGLLFAVAVRFGLDVSWTVPSILMAAAAFVALRLKVDILWVVLVGGAMSVLIL